MLERKAPVSQHGRQLTDAKRAAGFARDCRENGGTGWSESERSQTMTDTIDDVAAKKERSRMPVLDQQQRG